MVISKKTILIILVLMSMLFVAACETRSGSGDTYSVTFFTDGGQAMNNLNTDVIQEMPLTSKQGYRLVAWSTSDKGDDIVTFPLTLSANINLYARWEKTYSVTYYVDNVEYSKENYLVGEKVKVLVNPIKEGYTFSSWDKETPEFMGEENIVIHGGFTANKYMICFDSQYAQIIDAGSMREKEEGIKIVGYPAGNIYRTVDNRREVEYPFIEVTYETGYSQLLNQVKAEKENFQFEGWTYFDVIEGIRKDYVPSTFWTDSNESTKLLLRAKMVQKGTAGLEYQFNEEKGGYYVSGFDAQKAGDSIIVPSSYSGSLVIGIGEKAFYQNKTLKEVLLPSTIKEIGNSAFRSMTELVKINIPVSVTEIGSYAFSQSSKLREIEIPGAITELKDSTFAGSEGLREVRILSDRITKIGESVFDGAKSLVSVNIPKTVSQLGNFAFRNAESLTELLIFDTGIKRIGTGTFMGAKSLVTITLPNVTEIGVSAFEGAAKLRNISFRSDLNTIRARAFAGTVSLERINLPTAVIRIEDYAFLGSGGENLLTINVDAPMGERNNFSVDWDVKKINEEDSSRVRHTVVWH